METMTAPKIAPKTDLQVKEDAYIQATWGMGCRTQENIESGNLTSKQKANPKIMAAKKAWDALKEEKTRARPFSY